MDKPSEAGNYISLTLKGNNFLNFRYFLRIFLPFRVWGKEKSDDFAYPSFKVI